MTPQRVRTVVDYWDKPRGGVADHDGRPHVYRSLFRDKERSLGALNLESDADLFLLRPIDDAMLALMLEDWAIWERWLRAFHAGEAPPGSHPALPADRPRHDAIWPVILRTLQIEEQDPGVLRARAFFEGRDDCELGSTFVTWTLLDP